MSTPRQPPSFDDGPNGRFALEAARLAGLLPPDIRTKWLLAVRTEIFNPAHLNSRRHGAKSRKASAKLRPATQCMMLSSTLRILALSAELDTPVTDLPEVVSKDNIANLLEGPLKAVSDQTKVILLRSVASLAERSLGIDVQHIRLVAGRIMKTAERRKTPGRQRSYDEYWDVAHELAPYMEPGDVHDRETALEARHAATLGIAIECGLRRSELAGLQIDNVIIDRSNHIATIIVPKDIRKDGGTIVRKLSSSISGLVIDYIDNARPLFLHKNNTKNTNYLWLSSEGGPLCEVGVINTLRIQVLRVLGETACCILFRRANASRDDTMESETYMFLGHGTTSLVGQETYAQKDVGQAQRILRNVWAKVKAAPNNRQGSNAG